MKMCSHDWQDWVAVMNLNDYYSFRYFSYRYGMFVLLLAASCQCQGRGVVSCFCLEGLILVTEIGIWSLHAQIKKTEYLKKT